MQQEPIKDEPIEEEAPAPVVDEPGDDESEDVEPMTERQSDHA